MPCVAPLARASRKRLTFVRVIAPTIGCLLSLAAQFPALAQEGRALPGCEGPAALQKELNAKLNLSKFESMKSADQITPKVKTIDEFIAKYPRQAEPYRKLIEIGRAHV